MIGVLQTRTATAALIAAFVAALLFVNQANAAPYCSPGEAPQFRFGFAYLKSLLGNVMGEPLECEHYNAQNGDSLQQTTTGLAFYRKATNTPTFTDGWNHWAWSPGAFPGNYGLVHWTGQAIDPPGVIVPAATPWPRPTPSATATPIALPSPTPVQTPELVADAFMTTGSECEWNWDQGPSLRVTTFPPHMAEKYCLAARVNYWPAGWGYYTRWTYPGGYSENTTSYTPCPSAQCRGGWIRSTWTNLNRYTKSAGNGTVELLVNGVLVRTLDFTVVGSPVNDRISTAITLLALYHGLGPETQLMKSLNARASNNQIVFEPLRVGKLGSYSSLSRRIVLSRALLGESDFVVAAVLSHEGMHATMHDQGQIGGGEVGCYADEILAFTSQLQFWERVWGSTGKAPPLTVYEGLLNRMLFLKKLDYSAFLRDIFDLYGEQCDAL